MAKSKNLRLRCFVAMAVGRSDTDQIYDNHILPTLRDAGITAVFMGRLEHNDDIDKRIIREVEGCDFVIADLTYVRPSVYFEAGYAQRKVPVIYTCRQDHLGQGKGELRVHFDLLMRNIVPWSEPKDRIFARRLAKRVALVIKPLLYARHTEDIVRKEEHDFDSLALASRLDLVSEYFRDAILRRGYRSLILEKYRPAVGHINPWVARLPNRDTLDLCVLYVQQKFSERDIKSHAEEVLAIFRSRFEEPDAREYSLQLWQNRWPGYKNPKPAEVRDVKQLAARLILCSLEKISPGRLTSALTRYTPNGTSLRWDGTLFASYQRVLPISMSVLVFNPVRSQRDATARSRELHFTLRTIRRR